jgi:hypothetical protein
MIATCAFPDDDDRSKLRRRGIAVRKRFTSACKDSGASEPWQYGQRTNQIYVGVLGTDAKGLRRRLKIGAKASIRDNLSLTDLGLVVLGESMVVEAAHHLGLVNDDVVRRVAGILRRTRDEFKRIAS